MQTPPEVAPLMRALREQVSALIAAAGGAPPVVVGIHTGGLWVARALACELGLGDDIGEIDIGFHRDDFGARGIQQRIRPTRIPGSLEGRTVLLVDDVLHTGRTARAALNAIFEFGRPDRVWLATLVARNGRQLPIQPDAAGAELEAPAGSRVRLCGPDPLSLSFEET